MHFLLVFPASEVLWHVCLFPHDRCYLLCSQCILLVLLPAREVLFVVIYLIADVAFLQLAFRFGFAGICSSLPAFHRIVVHFR